MCIDLSGFHDETVMSLHIEGELHKDSLNIDGRKIKFIEPIKYKGEIYRAQGEKLIHILINYKYEEACGRCLESFINERDTVLSGRLVEEVDDITQDEEDDLIYYVGEKLDLTEDIMSMVILSLPMKPLCDEECKGLCPKCGTNLNKGKCNCIVENIDPRFAVLKDFFPKE
jgi:uncharacterized protein